jgi:cytochrome c oxidase subunit 3
MPVLTEEKPKLIVPPPLGPPGGGGGDGEGSGESWRSFPVSRGQVGLWVLLTGIMMLFAGLTSAYIVLRGDPGWQNITLPRILWVNTAVLVAGSIAIEFARGTLKKNHPAAANQWLVVAGGLGVAFLAGQVFAWRQLVNAGVFLPSTLHSSFFYLLTGIHGIHLLGGIGGLGFVLGKAWKGRLTVFSHEPLRLCATYWHFMDALWIYLFLLLLLA